MSTLRIYKVILNIFALSLLGTGLAMGTRSLGWLADAELALYDRLFAKRSVRSCPAAIAMVEADETDLKRYGRPIPGNITSQLLQTLQAQQAAVIGFAFFRDLPEEPDHAKLLAELAAPNVVAIGLKKSKDGEIPFPPGSHRGGWIDLRTDDGGTLRRIPFALEGEPTYATAIAATALGIPWQDIAARLQPYQIAPYSGPYGEFFPVGEEVLVPWQACHFPTISFTELLSGQEKISPGDIVLVGQAAPSFKNPFQIAGGRRLFDAQVMGQYVALQLDVMAGSRTPAIAPSNAAILLGLGLLSFAHVASLWVLRQRHYLIVAAAVPLISAAFGRAAILAYFATFELSTVWLPVVPALVAIGVNLVVVTFAISYSRLQDYTRALEAEVRERTAQLWEERNLVELGNLARGIFHDLNSPLSLIGNYTFLLGKRLAAAPPNPAELQQCHRGLEAAVAASYDIVDTISQALNLRRSSRSRDEGSPTKAAIQLGINIVRTNFGKDGIASKIAYQCELAEPLPKTRASQGTILRLVLNLVENAYNALSCKGAADPSFEGRILLRAWAEGKQLWLEVRDNGPGLSPELLAALHAWGDSPQERLQLPKGKGFGLYAVAWMLATEAGSLQVKSCPEDGTIFKLSLPLAS